MTWGFNPVYVASVRISRARHRCRLHADLCHQEEHAGYREEVATIRIRMAVLSEMKPSKKTGKQEPWQPRRGDKVMRAGSDSIWIITGVWSNGESADLCLEGTDLEWFSYPVKDLRPVK